MKAAAVSMKPIQSILRQLLLDILSSYGLTCVFNKQGIALPSIPLLTSNHLAVHHLSIPYSAHKLPNSADFKNPSTTWLRVQPLSSAIIQSSNPDGSGSRPRITLNNMSKKDVSSRLRFRNSSRFKKPHTTSEAVAFPYTSALTQLSRPSRSYRLPKQSL